MPSACPGPRYFTTSRLRGLALLGIYEDHRLQTAEQQRLLTEALRQMIEATPRR